MAQKFKQEEHEFLSCIAIDYISIDGLYRIVAINYDPLIPTKRNFKLILDFIRYLYEKYGTHLKCLKGPKMAQVQKSPSELFAWLLEEYNKGHYQNIDYGVWFDLDEEVIPEEYIPKEMEE